MSHQKQIEQQLVKSGITELSPEITQSLKSLKSGKDVLFCGKTKEDAFLTTSLHLLNKIEADLSELLPRALVFCNEIQSCEDLQKQLDTLSFDKDLKTITIHDKGDRVKQRNILYDGVDIVIGNPKRIGELYFQNGINLKHVKIIILLESNEITLSGGLTPILRLNESLPRCQKIVFYQTEHDKLTGFINECLINPTIL